MRWSSGKDSTFALDAARDNAAIDVAGLVVTFNGHADGVAMHGSATSRLDPTTTVARFTNTATESQHQELEQPARTGIAVP